MWFLAHTHKEESKFSLPLSRKGEKVKYEPLQEIQRTEVRERERNTLLIIIKDKKKTFIY